MTATVASELTGASSLVKSDFGTLILAGINTYAGATTLNAGTLDITGSVASSTIAVNNAGVLRVDGDSLLDTASVSLSNTSNLTLAGSETIGSLGGTAGTTVTLDEYTLTTGDHGNTTFAGVISGRGGLTKMGAGDFTMTGSNTYGGMTRVEGGMLLVGDGGTTGTLAGDIAIDNAGTLVFNRSDDIGFAGDISGGGVLHKAGNGLLTLTANSGAFTGTTRVTQGGLMVAAAAVLGGQVQVDADAVLGGTGRIGALDLAGTLAAGPGTGIGALHVDGNVVFRDSARWKVDVDSSGLHDQLQVGGHVDIEGGSVLALGAGSQWAQRTQYVLLEADGGIGGQFDDVSSNFAFLDPTLGYAGNNVTLTLLRNQVDFAAIAVSPNQRNTGGALQTLGAGNALVNAVEVLDAARARNAFDNLSGEVHASTRAMLLEDRFLQAGIGRRLDGQALAMQGARGSFWLAGHSTSPIQDGDGNGEQSRSRLQGVMAGADLNVGEHLLLGVALGELRGDHRLPALAAQTDVEGRSGGVYAQASRGGFSASGNVSRSSYTLDTGRVLALGSLEAQSLDSRNEAEATVAEFELAWQVQASKALLQPYLQVSRSALDSDAAVEHGGAAALSVEAREQQLTLTTAGLRSHWDISAGGISAMLGLALARQRASGDLDAAGMHAFVAGGPAFEVGATAIARDSALVELDVSLQISRNGWLSLGMHGRHGNGRSETGCQLNWRLGF
jgi:fibronectin-binding autotransporter adhesin